MQRRSGIDVAMLVSGVLMLILCVSLFATVGAMMNLDVVTEYASLIQFGVGAWYLLTSVLAIASGASGHKCPYVSVIIISILAIFVALGASVVAALVAYSDLFAETYEIAVSSSLITSTIFPKIWHSDNYEQGVMLSTGVMIINSISFIMLIVLSSLACCGTCCNSASVPPQANVTYITTSGGYTAASPAPPGYIGQPPVQQYNFQGMSNPNYDTPEMNIALKDVAA